MHCDQSRRFLFEEADIRGETVLLEESFGEILEIHQYAPGVARLLGEFLAAAVLLSTNLKFQGRLILQARSEGQIPLLMAECDDQLQVRGIARGVEQATSTSNDQLLYNGQLAITIDPLKGQRYQGIVALQAGSLAHNLDAYFAQSEQLKSRIWLTAGKERAAGFLLQQLPPQVIDDPGQRLQQWEHMSTLASTISKAELLELGSEHLLRRLYPQDPVRLFEAKGVTFHCSCSRERTRAALISLDPAEIVEILQESGSITMDCEFCNEQYCFDRGDLTDILGEEEEPQTLH